MNDLLHSIISRLEDQDPLHAKKLRKELKDRDPDYFERADAFFKKYLRYLNMLNKNLDYGVQCYLKWLADMRYEHLRFAQTGIYSSTSFDEVNQKVYNNPKVMEYYMNALLLSQFLWMHHYEMLSFFVKFFPKYGSTIRDYLEIGGGHGLFISEAISLLNATINFDLIDISPTSIDISKTFIDNQKVKYITGDILQFKTEKRYDFITMGEVLEHMEDPPALLSKVKSLLRDNGIIYITVPANAPAFDHIYLFRNVQEIRDMLRDGAFKIVNEVCACAENVSPEKAEKFKVTLMYGAFLQKER